MIQPAVGQSIPGNRATAESAERRELKWPMSTDRYMLWIDGVGAWQLCVGSQFQIGGPTLEDKSADICQVLAAEDNFFNVTVGRPSSPDCQSRKIKNPRAVRYGASESCATPHLLVIFALPL